jgi:tetratricopeptide (TPR) repeat protein
MLRIGVRQPLLILVLLTSSFHFTAAAQSSRRPLRASEVMAIEAGGALQENIAHDISTRGLNFHPDDVFLGLMKKAGADGGVIGALKTAKVSDQDAVKPDMELLGKLSDAAVLMKQRKYDEASTKLSEALDSSFARMETGFVMAELLQLRVQFETSARVYAQILQTEPDFPELHDRGSYALYRSGEDEPALNEAKIAIAGYKDDAEAHMNTGLVLSRLRNFDAAILEFKEALRIKPDYAGGRSGLGLVYERMGNDKAAIAEYKKAIALDPDYSLAHYNLGNTYMELGNFAGAATEFREAKRLCPDNPEYWQNLGAALSRQDPRAAIKHFREMEARFPNFEICHVCLADDLVWANDLKAGEEEYRLAMKLDPADARPHVGLGEIEEKKKNYDAALVEYRIAEEMDGSDSDAFKSAGKLLLEEKKDFAGAATELKQAEALEQSIWEVHELYAKALAGNGQHDLAIGEFKEAVALDPGQGQVISELAVELEKKGDWVAALEQYRKGAVADENRISKVLPGQSGMFYDPSPRKQYNEARARFRDHVAELRAAGKKDEAAELEKQVGAMDAGGSEKVRERTNAGDLAMQERKTEDAEKAYKEAVELGDQLPPGNESMIVALGKLGAVYGIQQRWDEAEAMFHQQLTGIEKAFGPANPRVIEALNNLGGLELRRGNPVMSENYFTRALEINVKNFGENSPPVSEALRKVSDSYEARGSYDKAEPYLLRAIKASEISAGPDSDMTGINVWALCNFYDRWGKPEKSQPCWHRATGILEASEGKNSPMLKDSLMAEANALRKLGRNDEAQKLEERIANILKAASTQ